MCEMCEWFAADDEPPLRVFEASGEPLFGEAQRAVAASASPEDNDDFVGSTKPFRDVETTRV